MRKCRNWQTSKTKDLVVGTPCGFKSHLPQSDKKGCRISGSLFFYPFVIPKSQAITCMLMQNIAAIPRSQLITFTIRSVLRHILFILGLACEQNIAAVDKTHVTVFVQISFHSRPPCVNLIDSFYGLNSKPGGVHMFVQLPAYLMLKMAPVRRRQAKSKKSRGRSPCSFILSFSLTAVLRTYLQRAP